MLFKLRWLAKWKWKWTMNENTSYVITALIAAISICIVVSFITECTRYDAKLKAECIARSVGIEIIKCDKLR